MPWKASATAILLVTACGAAHAGETIRYDKRIEKAALERVATKIGDLRGGHSHDADIAALIVLHRKTLTAPRPVPASGLPPMVMNRQVSDLVDPVITGSNRD